LELNVQQSCEIYKTSTSKATEEKKEIGNDWIRSTRSYKLHLH
jgi:hypothetical protein